MGEPRVGARDSGVAGWFGFGYSWSLTSSSPRASACSGVGVVRRVKVGWAGAMGAGGGGGGGGAGGVGGASPVFFGGGGGAGGWLDGVRLGERRVVCEQQLGQARLELEGDVVGEHAEEHVRTDAGL